MKVSSIFVLLFAAFFRLCPVFADEPVTRPDELIGFSSPMQAGELRSKAVRFLWGGDFLPGRQVVPLRCDKKASDFPELKSLKRVEKLRVEMEFGLDSLVWCFLPHKSNKRLVLLHHGCDEDSDGFVNITGRLLDDGYTVVDLRMPLDSGNSRPEVMVPGFGVLKMQEHWFMKFLSPSKGHAIKFFIEPVVAVINYFERNYEFADISIIGIDGGGWTATLAAALDPRIRTSFDVSGTYPIYLMTDGSEWNEWERTAPEFYKTVNYLELYALGAVGSGRRHVQVINCDCVDAKAKEYKKAVNAAVVSAGGDSGAYAFWIYESPREHIIPESLSNRILVFLNGRRVIKE